MSLGPLAGRAIGESGAVGAESIDTAQLAGVSPEPAEVGHRVVVGFEDVDLAGRDAKVGTALGAETG